MGNALVAGRGRGRDGAGGDRANEALEDTWLDLANYGLIALMVRRGIWGLPMEDGRD